MRKVVWLTTLILLPAIAHADTIVQNTNTQGYPGTFNFIGYNSSNVAFGQSVASQFLEFGGRFHSNTTSSFPDAATATAFGSGTTVTATQVVGGHTVTVNVPYNNLFLPELV